MCSILMSLSAPSSPLPNAGLANSCLASSDLLVGYLPSSQPTNRYLPATQAVNNLLNEKAKERFGSLQQEASSSYQNNDNLPPTDFPAIEWSFSEDDEEDEMDLSTASAPARFHIPAAKASRRGNLVRSISLVSSIMTEMQQQAKNAKMRPRSPKKRRKKTLELHKSGRTNKSTPHRLIALSHPTTVQGLHVGHHEGMFFL